MTAETLTPDVARSLAVALFNRTWELLDNGGSTPAEDREALASAMASRLFWGPIGTADNLAAGDWLVSHVASRLGYADLALDFAAAAHERVATAQPPLERWLLASTMEGLARAHDVAGQDAERDRWAAEARQVLETVTDDEDRDLITSQLDSIPGLGRP
jgi:hypothetical protein